MAGIQKKRVFMFGAVVIGLPIFALYFLKLDFIKDSSNLNKPIFWIYAIFWIASIFNEIMVIRTNIHFEKLRKEMKEHLLSLHLTEQEGKELDEVLTKFHEQSDLISLGEDYMKISEHFLVIRKGKSVLDFRMIRACEVTEAVCNIENQECTVVFLKNAFEELGKVKIVRDAFAKREEIMNRISDCFPNLHFQ